MSTSSSVRSLFRVTLAAVALALAVSPIVGRATPREKRAFETKDWYNVKTVGSPAMRPDGKSAGGQVTRVIEAKTGRINEFGVSAPRRVLNPWGRARLESTGRTPRLAPTGRRAFNRRRGLATRTRVGPRAS